MLDDAVLARAYGIMLPVTLSGIVAGALIAGPLVALLGVSGALVAAGASGVAPAHPRLRAQPAGPAARDPRRLADRRPARRPARRERRARRHRRLRVGARRPAPPAPARDRRSARYGAGVVRAIDASTAEAGSPPHTRTRGNSYGG